MWEEVYAEFFALQGFTSSVIIMWRLNATYTRIVEQESDNQYQFYREHEEWPQMRVLQILMVADVAVLEDVGGRREPEAGVTSQGEQRTPGAENTTGSGRLSPITETVKRTHSRKTPNKACRHSSSTTGRTSTTSSKKFWLTSEDHAMMKGRNL